MNVNILIEDSGHLFRYKSEVTPVKKKSKVRHPAARLQFLQRSQFPIFAAPPSLVTIRTHLCTIVVSHYLGSNSVLEKRETASTAGVPTSNSLMS